VIERAGLDAAMRELCSDGFEVVGPTPRDGAVVYDRLESTADLPVGWTDEQEGGRYRLRRRSDNALFGYVVGPESWKKYLFPPRLRLHRAIRTQDGFASVEAECTAPMYAFFGVRACELAAIAVQDRVFLKGEFADPDYSARRSSLFVLAVNCTQPGGTCFCASMGTGPRVESGYDLAITELVEGGAHRFVIEAGTPQGVEILGRLPSREASPEEVREARRLVDEAAGRMGRKLETSGLKGNLERAYEHPRWEEVASRCLACTNCTIVCPTCFCSAVEDTTDLQGHEAERWRRWDSCFTLGFTFMGDSSVRSSVRSRYRQWLTHKLSTWADQFGTSGCVGCGRCITWCPVGIDITEEARAICGAQAGPKVQAGKEA